jgi:hypothetical protein
LVAQPPVAGIYLVVDVGSGVAKESGVIERDRHGCAELRVDGIPLGLERLDLDIKHRSAQRFEELDRGLVQRKRHP